MNLKHVRISNERATQQKLLMPANDHNGITPKTNAIAEAIMKLHYTSPESSTRKCYVVI